MGKKQHNEAKGEEEEKEGGGVEEQGEGENRGRGKKTKSPMAFSKRHSSICRQSGEDT